MNSRSPSTTWRRKLVNATISNLKKSAMTTTIFTSSLPSRLNTAVQMWCASLNPSLPNNCFNNFLPSKKNSGVVSFGQMVFTLLPSASGGIGIWSNNTLPVRERQKVTCDNYHYSPRPDLDSYRGALPRGC